MNLSLLASRLLVGTARLGACRCSDRILHHPPETPECCALHRLPLAPEAAHLARHSFSSPEMFSAVCSQLDYYSYLNVLVTRGRRRIVLDSDNTWQEHPASHPAQPFYWRPLYTKHSIPIRGLVMPLRSAANNYYHTLIDNLPRLFALQHPSYRALPVTVLVPGSLTRAEKYFLPRVLPNGAQLVEVARNELYRPEAVLFSSFLSRQMCGYLPRPYLSFFLENVVPRRASQRHKRIYITRRDTRVGRRVVNEPELLAMLSRYGYVPYALEELTLPAQIELFYDAEAVVSPHGAGLTNLLFGQQLKVVELHPTNAIYPHYYFLCVALRHEYRFLCGDAPTRHSDFSVNISALETTVRELLCDEAVKHSGTSHGKYCRLSPLAELSNATK